MGPSGSGRTAKSCNQVIVASTIAVWAEMLAYAVANDLDPRLLIDTLEGSRADSGVQHVREGNGERFVSPGASTRNAGKDPEWVIGETWRVVARCGNADGFIGAGQFKRGKARG